MPSQFTQGITFLANDNVTNLKLHQLVNNGSLLPGSISEQPTQSASLTSADSMLFLDASIPALTKLQLAKLWAEPFEIGQTNKVTANFALVSSPVAQFTSASIANITGASAISGSAPSIAKAWVNFNAAINGSASISQTTNSQSAVGTLVTANFASAHGLSTGDSITIQSYASAPLIGTWVVTVTSGTQFTFNTTTAPTISATFTVFKIPIRSSYNVTSVGFPSGEGTGVGQRRYVVNFAPGTFADDKYCAVATCAQFDSTTSNHAVGPECSNTSPYPLALYSSTQCQLIQQTSTGNNSENPMINFVAFR